MLGRAAPRLWRAAHLARRSDVTSGVTSTLDTTLHCYAHCPAEQLISLRAFSAVASPHPALIRDFAIIGTQAMVHLCCNRHGDSYLFVSLSDCSDWEVVGQHLAPDADDLVDLRSQIARMCCAAHVDHGKTTLMDRLLAHCGHASAQERFMDSNALEKERGITINSKYTSLQHGKYTLNAVDTPGHADFGGEVER